MLTRAWPFDNGTSYTARTPGSVDGPNVQPLGAKASYTKEQLASERDWYYRTFESRSIHSGAGSCCVKGPVVLSALQ